MKIKYDMDLMKYMSLFETLTRAKLKDCIMGDVVLFIVEENEIGKAIGRGGVNVHKIEGLLKKKIKIVEFNPDIRQFVRNYLYPLEINDVNFEAGVVTVFGPDTKSRGLIIGRDRANVRKLEEILKRYFEISEIRVA